MPNSKIYSQLTNQGNIEAFFYRSLENRVNEKMLDDYSYNIPLSLLRNYIKGIIQIPFEEFLYFIISWDYPAITTEDMTQSSSFSAAEIEMCNVIIHNDNPGYSFEQIGALFPQYCKSQTPYALKKYGENQIKTSKQLGLAFSYYNSWYLSCIGYIYIELTESERQAFLARSILRDPFYGTIVRDLISNDVTLNNYLKNLSPSTIQRRSPGIIRILRFAVNAAKNENIPLHNLIRILPPK